MEGFERCCVRGNRVYQTIWDAHAVVGESLQCAREVLNEHDRYSVAVKKNGVIIGYLPRKVSRLCLLFLRRDGCISCTVTGRRQYSADLPQGGLEVLCIKTFLC